MLVVNRIRAHLLLVAIDHVLGREGETAEEEEAELALALVGHQSLEETPANLSKIALGLVVVQVNEEASQFGHGALLLLAPLCERLSE
jgi:hypothetical protein